jgi:chemotaxis protein CheX
MRVEFVNPFVQAALEVIESEIGGETDRGEISLHRSAYTTDEVTAVVGVAGRIAGLVMYSMSEETARAIVERLMGREFPEFDGLAQSGIGELGNVITGRAGVLLAEAGYPSNITPPALLMGKGSMVTTLDLNRLVFPLQTDLGTLEIQVVLKENTHTVPTIRAATPAATAAAA